MLLFLRQPLPEDDRRGAIQNIKLKKNIMDKKNFAFDRMNYILLAIGMAIVILGFILMSGSGSTESSYDPDIFSARRIKLAPVVCLVGFVSMIYAVIRKPK